jgi:hypothetical protein
MMLINIGRQFVDENQPMRIDSKYTIYPFTLSTRWDQRTLYCIKAEERKAWVDVIRKSLGFSDIYKFYELGVR